MANETAATQADTQQSAQQTQRGQHDPAQRSGLQGSAQGGQQGQQMNVGQSSRGGALQERRQGGLMRYGRSPFALMQELSDEMDRVFDSFFSATPIRNRMQQQEALPRLWAPEVEMSEEGKQLRVCVDLPGLTKDNVKIDVQDGALVIQGERREERSEGGEQQGFRRSERSYGSFYRAIPLPEYVDTEKAEARMKDGVLSVTFPIAESRQARRLEIQG
jgi:HSP20 family protein